MYVHAYNDRAALNVVVFGGLPLNPSWLKLSGKRPHHVYHHCGFLPLFHKRNLPSMRDAFKLVSLFKTSIYSFKQNGHLLQNRLRRPCC